MARGRISGVNSRTTKVRAKRYGTSTAAEYEPYGLGFRHVTCKAIISDIDVHEREGCKSRAETPMLNEL